MSLKTLRGSFVPIGAYTPIGSMHSYIAFYNAPAVNGDGTFADPVFFANSWAKVVALNGRELYKAQQVVQEVTHMITVPFLEGLDEGMSIQFDGRTFRIQAVQDPDERKVEQRILAIERGQNAGE